MTMVQKCHSRPCNGFKSDAVQIPESVATSIISVKSEAKEEPVDQPGTSSGKRKLSEKKSETDTTDSGDTETPSSDQWQWMNRKDDDNWESPKQRGRPDTHGAVVHVGDDQEDESDPDNTASKATVSHLEYHPECHPKCPGPELDLSLKTGK